ncbi:MAG TPA: Gfo/Idh/MocA family oxidoreductase [Planctomycetota bacterium]|nr:Gfo/Idh/MocA family oxidoreductase [Planctomycetota bacterium]
MAEKIRIGMIGVGQIAQYHMGNYSKMQDVELVAAADLDAAKLAQVAKQFNIPNTYADFRKMLERDDIQAVDVCLHNNLHAPATIAAFEAGKDVYCEKPMAGAYADAERMLKAAGDLGRKLSIQLSTLFTPTARAARILIDEGRLGRVYHARSTGYRRLGRPFVDGYGTSSFVKKEIAAGGALYDMGVYHIAQILFLLNNPDVLRISGKVYQETAIDAKRFKESGYNVEELGMGFVRFNGGVSLDIIEAWAVHMDAFEGSSIFGSDAGIRLEPFGFFSRVGDMVLDSKIDLNTASFRWQNVHGIGNVFDSPQHHWVAGLQGRVDLLPTAEIALNTMLISEGIYLSDQLGREVTAEEVRKLSKSSAVKL